MKKEMKKLLQRKAIRIFWIKGWSIKRIAMILNVSHHEVKDATFILRKK